MKKYIIALDQGTTSSRAMLIDRAGRPVASVQRPFPQIYPQPGWVEHDPQDILSSQLGALTELILSSNVDTADIDSIGITNQRETTIVWDRATGEPIMNAIVWQCRRTAPMVEAIASDPATAAEITARTGLVPDAYFSASKLAWILGEVPGARARAEAGELCFGTVDSWLIWKLTDGAVHATDVTNASRTMLYNIHERRWDPFLLKLFGIPEAILPEVRPSSGSFGITANPGLVQGIPICGVAGDQQAALFGQCCFHAGQAKNTYGTGCFLLMHTGHEACASEHGLVTTVAASAPTRGTPSTRSRAVCSWPAPSSSGSATSSASSTASPKPTPSLAVWPRPTASSSCPRSRAWAPPGGMPTPAALFSASPAAPDAPTSCGRLWSRSPTRCATWPAPWPRTRTCRFRC